MSKYQNGIHGSISHDRPGVFIISYTSHMEINVAVYPCPNFPFSYFHCRYISFAFRLVFSQVQYPGYVEYIMCQTKQKRVSCLRDTGNTFYVLNCFPSVLQLLENSSLGQN